MMALVQDIVQTGQRVGGTSELQVGEGRADAPVGTTLALIDQAVKIMNSVHKRLFTSQAEEIQMIVDVFKENPDTFANTKCKSKKSKTIWDTERFLEAVNNCELVPQADPNTASMGQRAAIRATTSRAGTTCSADQWFVLPTSMNSMKRRGCPRERK